jgi:prostaglandin-H2 D-isomerase / glutathione transferase
MSYPTPTPPPYELLYFDGPGRAESIRILLHAAGIPFVDRQVTYSEWTVSIKNTTPLHQVPTLKMGDTTYIQSLALTRFAAKKAGFYPDDDLECLLVDEMLETCNDIGMDCPRDADPVVCAALRRSWQATTLTRYANFIEMRLAKHHGKGTIGRPSVADLAVKNVVDSVRSGFFEHVDRHFFDVYPNIQLRDLVRRLTRTTVDAFFVWQSVAVAHSKSRTVHHDQQSNCDRDFDTSQDPSVLCVSQVVSMSNR